VKYESTSNHAKTVSFCTKHSNHPRCRPETDRDIALAVAAENKDPKNVCAYEIMTDEPITVASDADIESALRMMSTGNVRRLPVCEKGKLVGMLSSADLASELKEEIDNYIGLEGGFAKH
jgi:signal-transduction protein with cAMP-binding, CBS, and nucleotidyltransferase domain